MVNMVLHIQHYIYCFLLFFLVVYKYLWHFSMWFDWCVDVAFSHGSLDVFGDRSDVW